MTDSHTPKHGFEIDGVAFAETLREIADGIEDHSVLLVELSESHTAMTDDISNASLSFKYHAEDEELITPIQYKEDSE